MNQHVQVMRMARLEALCLKFWIARNLDGPWQTASEEDVAVFLRGEEPIMKWAAVTRHAGDHPSFFIYPTFLERADAEERASRHMRDDIFQETPVYVVDMDEGSMFSVLGVQVTWDDLSEAVVGLVHGGMGRLYQGEAVA